MPSFNFQDSDTGNYFDVLADVDFASPLNGEETAEALQIVHQVLANIVFAKIFVGLINTEIKVSSTNLQLRFRYLAWIADEMKIVPESQKEYMGMRRINLIYHIFAKVDEKYKVVDTEFLPYFRSWIDLPDKIKDDDF